MTTQKRFESSKERKHGAKLIITKLDGQLIKGELIAVKPNSLLLLDTEGKDVSVNIADIKFIKIVKKSKLLTGAWVGIAVGGGAGVLLGGSASEGMSLSPSEGRKILGVFGAVVGLLVGGITGAMAGTDKTIQIEGMTDLQIQEALDKLRKKARIRDYK